jgi:hypothetical protein
MIISYLPLALSFPNLINATRIFIDGNVTEFVPSLLDFLGLFN